MHRSGRARMAALPGDFAMLRRILALAVLLVLILAPAAFLTRSQAQPPAPPEHLPEVKSEKPRYRGAGSCASMACHNGQGPVGQWKSEYTTWAGHDGAGRPYDPHLEAYDVLFNEVSKTIAANLRQAGIFKPGENAHESAICLNCHVAPEWDRHHAAGLVKDVFKNDGVSCESCHGPAEHYLAEHYKDSWKLLSPQRRAELGWVDTKDLASRARMCAGCHVGAPGKDGGLGRDVWHDLYAAGHPPLLFEFGAFHALETHHWQDFKDKDPNYRDPVTGRQGHADFEARAWAMGQLVTADAALDVLVRQAEQSEAGKRPWPEFAQYDCFACHHDLQADSWRQKRDQQRAIALKKEGKKRRAGTMPLRPYYFTMVPRAAAAVGAPDEPLPRLLDQLHESLANRPNDRAGAVALAKQARDRIGVLVQGFDRTWANQGDTGSLYREILAKDAPRVSRGWDEAAQVYLALAALENAWSDMKSLPAEAKDLRPLLLEQRSKLHFPQRPVRYLSPADFDPFRFQAGLEKLRK